MSDIKCKEEIFDGEFCDEEFEDSKSLNVHRRIHLGEKRFKCSHCNYTAEAGSDTLTSHMRTHFQEKPYKCPEPGCHYAFVTSGRLERHSVVHSGEKPFVCQACDEEFDQSTDFTIHMEYHRVPQGYNYETELEFTLRGNLAIMMANVVKTPPPGSDPNLVVMLDGRVRNISEYHKSLQYK